MKVIGLAACGGALLAVASPAAAQLTVEGNGARADHRWGGELGIGYGIGAAGFKLTPLVGGFVYANSSDRFVRDDTSGDTRCRDRDTGRSADDSRCDGTAVKAYGKLEATYSLPLVATFGAGVRVSAADSAAYGTLAFALAPAVKVKANAGKGYYALGLRVGL